jgi:hypothetical protein
MLRKIRWAMAITTVGLACQLEGFAWGQDLPAAPVPVSPSSPVQPGQVSGQGNLPAPPAPTVTPGPINLPPPPPPPPGYIPVEGPYPRREVFLDQPFSPPPGWFFNLQVDSVGTHIKNRLTAPVTVDPLGVDTVHLAGAELDWTGAPHFELGYRFPDNLGEVMVAYKLVDTEGNAILPGYDLDGSDGFLHSRFNMNVVDIDYATPELPITQKWNVKFRAGARIAAIYFDNNAQGQFIDQRVTNDFVGGGPHGGFDVWRRLGGSGLALFGRLDTGVVFGRVKQRYEDFFIVDDGSGNAVSLSGETDVHHTQAVPMLGLELGLSWTPLHFWHWTRFDFGYTFEQWWDVGHAGGSQADITSQGVFLKASLAF